VFFDSLDDFPRLNPGAAGPGPANQCTLYYGHGWLAGQAEYSHVRERLNSARVSLSVRNAFDKDFPEWFLRPYAGAETAQVRWDALYLSNLCLWANQGCSSVLLPGLAAAVDKAGEDLAQQGRSPTSATIALLHSHLEQPHILSSSNVRPFCPGIPPSTSFENSHLSAWAAVRQALRGGGDNSGSVEELELPEAGLLEVTTKPNWGFHEVLAPGRAQMDLQEFLVAGVPKRSYETVLLHILLGEGTPLEAFRAVLMRAVHVAKRQVLILEHNKDSVDWALGKAERQFSLSALQLEKVVDQTLRQEALSPYTLSPTCYVPGYQDGRRNMLSTVHIGNI